MLKKVTPIIIAAATLALAGCGTTTFNRATTGAGIGAATGAVIGAIAPPFGPGIGALAGAGIGGTIGAGTTPSQVDLGAPVWAR